MLSAEQRDQLKHVARQSIAHGLSHGEPLAVSVADYDEELGERRATFITLTSQGALRGCIGMLEPVRPLVEDVAGNAFSAAFRDSRFQPLREDELDSVDIHVSILNPPESIAFTTEDELASQLRAGTDGLILREGLSKATFLPSVWDSIQDSKEFIRHLKQKAGLPPDYWSEDMRAWRYTVEEF